MKNQQPSESSPATEKEPISPQFDSSYQFLQSEPQASTPPVQSAQSKSINLWVFVASVGVVLILAFVMSGLFFGQSAKTKHYKAEVAKLTATLQSTEEGKKLLEQANKDLDRKATEAQEETKEVSAKLNDVQADLDAKLAEVEKVNKNLQTKQSELSKAERGIAKFAQLETLFNQYDKDIMTFLDLISESNTAMMNSDWDEVDQIFAKMDPLVKKLDDEVEQILALFEVIKSGKY